MQVHKVRSLLWLIILFNCLSIHSQDRIISYKLPNGLTVCLNEDHSNQFVTGAVVCKIGDNLMPKGKEALAHCIEHMLFKGTKMLGTNNWESEKPLYDSIVALYQRLDKAQDEQIRKIIKKRIAEFSDSASRYIIHGEFYLLQEDIGGGEGFTYYNDYTIFYSSFLPDKLDKWIDLNSHRFTEPIFREFMKEQMVISQEYFEKSKDNSAPRWDYIFKALYGKPTNEELSANIFNLSLSDVIDYYNKYYVPANMAVIISGNFKAEEVKSKIEECFSKIPYREVTVQALRPSPNFKRREVKNAYYDRQKSVTLLFKGAPHLSPDFYPYRVAINMLANNFNGLQDSIRHNGLVESINSRWNWGKNECLYYVYANPFERQSLKSVKRVILNQIEKLASGNFTDSLLTSAKRGIGREVDLERDNLFNKVSNIAQHFVYGMEIPNLVKPKSLFEAVSRDDIMRVAKEYLLNNYVELYPSATKKQVQVQRDLDIPRNNKLSLQKNYKSAYACHFDSIPDFRIKFPSFSFEDVFDTSIIKGVKYYSTVNRVNKVFHLKFAYKPSQEVNNLLNKINFNQRFEYLSVDGMETFTFRHSIAQYGGTYYFEHFKNGIVILNIYGMDEYFNEIMHLISTFLKNPNVNIKEIHKVQNIYSVNNNKQKRKIFPVTPDSMNHIYKQMFNSLFEVSYYGSLSTDKALATVRQQLDLREKKIQGPQNTVNQYYSNVPEIQLWLYSKPSSPKYKIHLLVLKNYVFRILWDEIRVANGLAYQMSTDIKVPDKDSLMAQLYASVRTKDYQIPVVSEILTGILKNLPERESVFECARQQVKKEYLNKLLDPEIAFNYIKDRKNRGMDQNTEIDEMGKLDALSLVDLIDYYKSEFGQSNVKMDIYGNINEIGKANYDRLKRDLELKASL